MSFRFFPHHKNEARTSLIETLQTSSYASSHRYGCSPLSVLCNHFVRISARSLEAYKLITSTTMWNPGGSDNNSSSENRARHDWRRLERDMKNTRKINSPPTCCDVFKGLTASDAFIIDIKEHERPLMWRWSPFQQVSPLSNAPDITLVFWHLIAEMIFWKGKR